MIIRSSQSNEDERAFELKASTLTLPVLHLLSPDMSVVSQQLAEKVDQAPDFFQNAPVVIDLQSLNGSAEPVDFALLIGLMRGHGLLPVGVRGGDAKQNEMAAAMELALLSEDRPKRAPEQKSKEQAALTKSYLHMQPVRSGQRLYAQGRDLIVVAPISSGAEILADGNIHVYGSLRGRALAGVKGDSSARIFCKNLDAELVAIAGNYRVNEDLNDEVRTKAVQIYLEGHRLRFDFI